MNLPPMKAGTEYEALMEGMDEYRPRCRGDVRFTTDLLPRADVDRMRNICARCPLRALCDNYARAAGVTAGFWAGRDLSRKQKESA